MKRTLLGIYFKRYLREGKAYIIIGLIAPIVILIAFTFLGGRNASGVEETTLKELASSMGLNDISMYLAALLFPFLMPIFAITGSVMAPALYSEDKSNGFYEFVMSSTRIGPRDIFWSIILTGLAVSLIVLSVIVVATLLLFQIVNGSIPFFFARELLTYSVPIAVVASLIVSSIAFVSEALTKRISFVNSPAGMAPIIGVIIAVIPLLFFETQVIGGPVDLNKLLLVLAYYVAAAFVFFVFIFYLTTKRMARERFLP